MSFGGRLRGLASDAFIYGLANALGRFFTFLLVPLYTNLLLPDEYGLVNTLYAYIALAAVLYGLGLDSAYLRFAAPLEGRDAREVFSAASIALVGAGVAASLVLAACSRPVAAAIGLGEHAGWVTAAAFILLLDSLSLIPFAYLRLRRQARAYAAVKLASIAVNLALSVLFLVVLRHGAAGILEANLAASAFALVLVLPLYERLLRPRFDRALLLELLAFGLPLLPSGLAALVVQVADRPILKLFLDDAAVGVYTANYKLGMVMMILVTVFQYAWQPFFLTRGADADARPLFARVLTYYLAVAMGLFLAVTLFVDRIVRLPVGHGRTLFHPDYYGGLGIVPWVLLGYVALGVYTNLSAGPTLVKKTGVFPRVTGLAAITNLAANLALIPWLGMMGAALATLIAYLVMAAAMAYFARRLFPVDYEWPRILRVILAAAGLWAAFAALGGAALAPVFRLLLLAAYPAILIASGFLEPAETAAIRRLLGRLRRRAEGG